MATLLEPPALLSVAVVLAAGAGALYYGLRPALRRPLPVATSARDEVWGVDDPPPPLKRRYVYPADRPIEAPIEAAAPAPALYTVQPALEPEPFTQMPSGPAVAPAPVVVVTPPASAVPPPSHALSAAPVAALQPPEPRHHKPHDADEDEEEVSLADLFRPRRRPPAPPKRPSAPDDAPT